MQGRIYRNLGVGYLAPTFLVEPGRYCGILYNEKPGRSNAAFCLMVYSAAIYSLVWFKNENNGFYDTLKRGTGATLLNLSLLIGKN